MKKLLLILLCLPMIFSCGYSEIKNDAKKAGVLMEQAVEVIETQLNAREKEAEENMFMAEFYFQKDSFNLALNGDGKCLGFLDIADEYSGTKSGELANYYAGLSYLNIGDEKIDFENAIEYLDDFSSDDIILSSLALGSIGDAYMELGDTDNALSYYEDAVSNSENEFTTPRYMLKQAMIHEVNGDYNDALALYKEIKEDYKYSHEGNDIEKYIARVENRR